MSTMLLGSDREVLDLLRRSGPAGVTEIADNLGVTATAVRQRLTRMMAAGMIERKTCHQGRGRPSHQYSVTEKGTQQAGSNLNDLAIALWQELQAIPDLELREQLMERVVGRLAQKYHREIQGSTYEEKMKAVQMLLSDRGVQFKVDDSGPLPILQAVDCPYPTLAEHDRSVCTMEQMLVGELLEEKVDLAECRLDGHACCRFQVDSSPERTPEK
ncbi:Winged helix-turn-helix transcriptional regulator [Planctomycetales bacterium 10988]|nr:Winged helix-turn-helix transcriptional regulator [Planctomycetales bacterium 10988]